MRTYLCLESETSDASSYYYLPLFMCTKDRRGHKAGLFRRFTAFIMLLAEWHSDCMTWNPLMCILIAQPFLACSHHLWGKGGVLCNFLVGALC